MNYHLILEKLFLKYYYFSLLFTFFLFLSWFLANSILIYSSVIDPGTTEYVLKSPQYQSDILMLSEIINQLPRCPKCGLPKPLRAHHCSTCGKCHLKMDHHCAVTGKCVALRNQQPFIVANHWAFLCLITNLIIFIIGIVFLDFQTEEKYQLFIYLFFDIVLIVFFYTYIHQTMENVYKNVTTIENIYGDDYSYDFGEVENYFQVFGDLGFLGRFIPQITEFCGFEWATTEYHSLKFITNSFSQPYRNSNSSFYKPNFNV